MLEIPSYRRYAPQNGGPGNRGMFFSGGAGASERAELRRVKVLIADDDLDTVLSLKALLEIEKFEVLGVHSGEAALRAVPDFKPDAMLLDIGMPHLTGYDIARVMRALRGNGLLLIAVTALTKSSDRIAARIAGFDHHVSKPYEPEDILGLLRPLAEKVRRN